MKKSFIFIVVLFISILAMSSKVLAYNKYEVGDIVNYMGEDYYVIHESNEDESYITLLKDKSLTSEQLTLYNNLDMTFTSNYTSFCQNNVNCEGKYENSLIKEIVDNWAGAEFNENDLVQIDGYKARIMSKDDLFNHLGFYRANLSATSFTFTTDDYNFVFFHEPYWIMDMEEEDLYYHNAFAMKKTTSDRVHVSGEASSRAYNVTLKPVINIRKCLIEDNCDEITSESKITEKKAYNFGEKVSIDGEDYYVVIPSNEYSNYVTLLKDKPLTKSEIQEYYDGTIEEDEGVGLVKYDGSSTYTASNIKKIVDKWAKDKFETNSKIYKKYKARILSINDLINYLYFEMDSPWSYIALYYISGKDTPDWVINEYNYWTMTPCDDSGQMWVVGNYKYGDYNSQTFVGITENEGATYAAVRPLVTIDKCQLNPNEEGCLDCLRKEQKVSVKMYNNFNIGQEVIFKGEKYYVARRSSSLTHYVTLVREKPFTFEELNRYSKDINGQSVVNNYAIVHPNGEVVNGDQGSFNYNGRYITYPIVEQGKAFVYEDGTGGMQYYSSDQCGYVNGEVLTTGCKSDYDLSNVKIVIDNWTNDQFSDDDLVEINGYKSRIVNQSERDFLSKFKIGIKYSYWVNSQYYDVPYSNSLPVKVLGKMYGNYGNNIDISRILLFTIGSYYSYPAQRDDTFHYLAVWPVINIDKCSLDNGCIIDEKVINVCYNEDNKELEKDDKDDSADILEVENTSKNMSFIKFLSGILLIISGLYLYQKNFLKKK